MLALINNILLLDIANHHWK